MSIIAGPLGISYLAFPLDNKKKPDLALVCAIFPYICIYTHACMYLYVISAAFIAIFK